MKFTRVGKDNRTVFIEDEAFVITDVQSAMDLMATVYYQEDCDKIIIDKSLIDENFFQLKTKIAGEILQKFVNYHVKLAIIGDFTVYNSKALHDFIYECNNGHNIFFVEDLDTAIAKLDSK